MKKWIVILTAVCSLAVAGDQASAATQPRACPAEDSPSWNWVRCGNNSRGVVTMWGTPKVVSCGDLRWLVRHDDLDPRTPWLKGDFSCGRRVGEELNY